ncbi:GNAT family N-acetyltransferase [bacterium]|nr:GNAT family N-acetyltransferase [candidate division CSSED10-310 bacterium]
MNRKRCIRYANEKDIRTLTEFNMALAAETEGITLNSEKVEAGVAHVISHPEMGFYLVAEDDNRIEGSLLITPEWSDWRNGFFWWIQSVYVTPDNRRKGVYRDLYTHVLKLGADVSNVCGYRLYVERNNLAAQKTYEILGMRKSDYVMYEREINPLER